jgi:2-succinyl-5-enolpyruvyl-6-hydroxy-3-cyclohexene-1-carboxylate synthase
VTTPVRIVVINNGGGGIFHFLPQEEVMPADEFEALLGTPRAIDVAKAAEMFGLTSTKVEALPDLAGALRAGTGLIDVPIDRRQNLVLHRRLTGAVLETLAASLRS